jgi:hypothetical protein
VADDAELLTLLLDGLGTQLQAELPIEYHLLNVARTILRVGARRDAASEIPAPDEKLMAGDPPIGSEARRIKLEDWWTKFQRHAMLVVANRNVHKHQSSCLAGKQGKTGCRFNAPWGHDVDKSRLVELFCDASEEPPSAEIAYRCCECHAEGAMKDATLTPEARECRINEEDNRRSLFYTSGTPTLKAEVGNDSRILHVDLKRRLLPAMNTVKTALDLYNANKTPENISNLRKVLKETIDEHLGILHSTPALHPLRDRLIKLTEEPTTHTEGIIPVIQVPRSLCFFLRAHHARPFVQPIYFVQ